MKLDKAASNWVEIIITTSWECKPLYLILRAGLAGVTLVRAAREATEVAEMHTGSRARGFKCIGCRSAMTHFSLTRAILTINRLQAWIKWTTAWPATTSWTKPMQPVSCSSYNSREKEELWARIILSYLQLEVPSRSSFKKGRSGSRMTKFRMQRLTSAQVSPVTSGRPAIRSILRGSKNWRSSLTKLRCR